MIDVVPLSADVKELKTMRDCPRAGLVMLVRLTDAHLSVSWALL